MAASDTIEPEHTAEAYDNLLVPALFEVWARRLTDATGVRQGDRVLDVACGTGILARTIAPRVLPSGSVSGLDLNPAMLAVARRRAPAIDWRQGNAESLPYEDETFDLVVSQFGLTFFSDPATALREMYRVLRDDGRLSLAVFDSLDRAPGYTAMADVFERVVGPPVGAALRFPFSTGDRGDLATLLSGSTFDRVEISTISGKARFSNPRHMVLSDVHGWFPFAGIQLKEEQLDSVLHEAEKALQPFRRADGSVEFDVSVHVVGARKGSV